MILQGLRGCGAAGVLRLDADEEAVHLVAFEISVDRTQVDYFVIGRIQACGFDIHDGQSPAFGSFVQLGGTFRREGG